MDQVAQQNAAMVEETTPHAFRPGPKAPAANGGRAEMRKPASRPARAGAKAMVVNGAPVSAGEDGWTEF
jgi:hypothetical protein